MADMDVVWKRRSNLTWLWIAIALVVIGALWFAFGGRGSQSTRTGHSAVPSAPFVTARPAAQT
jgi:hypothetical protein